MLFAMLMVVTMDAVNKQLISTYPVLQVVWARFAGQMLILAAVFAPRYRRVLATARPGRHLSRSLALWVGTILVVAAFAHMPLADAIAVFSLSPVFAAAMAPLVLGERSGRGRWLGAGIAFAGALLIIRPGTGVFHWAALLPLVGAACIGFYYVTTRQLSAEDGPETLLFYSTVVGAVANSVLVPFVWVGPTSPDWGLLLLPALFAAFGHYAMARAFAAAPASFVSPFSYSGLLWAAIYGAILFGDVPDGWTILGAGGIVLGGVLILRHGCAHLPLCDDAARADGRDR